MARIVRREKRQRGVFGWIFLLLFWAFNGLMLWWLVWAFGIMARGGGDQSEAAQAGRAIGGFISTTMIFSIWGAGALILGLFVLLTRGQTVVIEETHQPQAELYPAVDMRKWSAKDRDRHLAGQKQIARAEPSMAAQEPSSQATYGWREVNGVRTAFT